MSRFSGKCDIYDCYGDMADDKIKISRFWITTSDHKKHELRIDSQRDLARYYPYLVSIGSFSKKDGARIVMSQRSYIDCEEEEHLGFNFKFLLQYYKKCKRKKVPFDVEEAKKIVSFGHIDKDDPLYELIVRVKDQGEKATTEGIHLYMQEYYRKEWLQCLLDFGYEEFEAREIVYGWERAWEYEKSKKEASKKTQGEDTKS